FVQLFEDSLVHSPARY
ncbi:unnamed protein product, partial [Allacma fusca]